MNRLVARPVLRHGHLDFFTTTKSSSSRSLSSRLTVSSSPSFSPTRSLSASVRRQTTQAPPFPSAPPRSLLSRTLGFLAIAIVASSAGFIMSALPAISTTQQLLNPPSDAETLTLFAPYDDKSAEVEAYINSHPVVLELRKRPELSESRPHLKIPPAMRAHNLTGGTLMGENKVVVPPFTWTEEGGRSLVSVSYLGIDLCGHPGIVHGGFLATMLDEGLARCCFGALPNKIGMTANLNINYRAPARANSYVVLRATTTKVEGRKAWVEGRIETLVNEGETPVVLADATALFIEPKQAASMQRMYPVN